MEVNGWGGLRVGGGVDPGVRCFEGMLEAANATAEHGGLIRRS
jgi:hypothetical protein